MPSTKLPTSTRITKMSYIPVQAAYRAWVAKSPAPCRPCNAKTGEANRISYETSPRSPHRKLEPRPKSHSNQSHFLFQTLYSRQRFSFRVITQDFLISRTLIKLVIWLSRSSIAPVLYSNESRGFENLCRYRFLRCLTSIWPPLQTRRWWSCATNV